MLAMDTTGEPGFVRFLRVFGWVVSTVQSIGNWPLICVNWFLLRFEVPSKRKSQLDGKIMNSYILRTIRTSTELRFVLLIMSFFLKIPEES